jgi:hypothetical protein
MSYSVILFYSFFATSLVILKVRSKEGHKGGKGGVRKVGNVKADRLLGD